MTLYEYMHQEDPKPNLMVVLDESEYKVRGTVKVNPTTHHTFIDIPIISEKYNTKGRYIQVNDGRRLYAPHPETGDIKGRDSVFYLPVKDTATPDIIKYRQFLDINSEFLTKWMEANPNPKDLPQHNENFYNAYSEFLESVREEYSLTPEDIAFWLKT